MSWKSVWRMMMSRPYTGLKRTLVAAALVSLVAPEAVRADPMDDLNNTQIPRDVSSNSRIERIDVWGARPQTPASEGLSPLDIVNISISLRPSIGESICINCNSADVEDENDDQPDDQSIIKDLKKSGKILWTLFKRSSGGALRFLFHSQPLGDYCSDKPQDLACQRKPAPTDSLDPGLAFSIERHDLTPAIRSSVHVDTATLFGHPLRDVAGAVFEQSVAPDKIRIDSYIQDDATGTLVLTLSVDLPGSEIAAPTTTSRPPAPPVRIDRHGRVFIEP